MLLFTAVFVMLSIYDLDSLAPLPTALDQGLEPQLLEALLVTYQRRFAYGTDIMDIEDLRLSCDE